MIWFIVSALCTASGCTALPPLEFAPGTPAQHCRMVRNAMVVPEGAALADSSWMEAACRVRKQSVASIP